MRESRDDKYLRIVRPDDEEEVHRLLCMPEVYEYLADGVEPPLAVTLDWIETSVGDAVRYGGGLWALVCPRQQKIVGLTRLSDFADGELQLTYLLHPDIRGRGYATRMAHTAMHHAFDTGAATAIWAGADVPNTASVAVMKHLGMRFRRDVDYPAGAGVEYIMAAADFDRGRVETLSIV